MEKNGPGISDQWLFRLQNKFRVIPLLVMYYLTKFDYVIQNIFWIIPKITSANLLHNLLPILDIINYSIFICPFESGKYGKERKHYRQYFVVVLLSKKLQVWVTSFAKKGMPSSGGFFKHFFTTSKW